MRGKYNFRRFLKPKKFVFRHLVQNEYIIKIEKKCIIKSIVLTISGWVKFLMRKIILRVFTKNKYLRIVTFECKNIDFILHMK